MREAGGAGGLPGGEAGPGGIRRGDTCRHARLLQPHGARGGEKRPLQTSPGLSGRPKDHPWSATATLSNTSTTNLSFVL